MIKWILVIGWVMSLSFVNAQIGSELQLLKYVNAFSSDSLKLRSAGSEMERKANKYIRENWVDGKRTSFYSWEYTFKKDADSLKSEMVGTFLYNKAKATILIGASLEKSTDIALLIGLQNQLSQLKLDVNVILVGFTDYDNQHLGANYIATHLPKKAKDIRLIIHLNDVGGMSKENGVLSVAATAGIFEELQLLPKLFELEKLEDALLIERDTKNYYNRGIQCLSVTTNSENALNTNGIHKIQEFLVQWVITK